MPYFICVFTGKDGRAGMAAIVPEKSLDFTQLYKHITEYLPSYARPLFLRWDKITQVILFDHLRACQHIGCQCRSQGRIQQTVTYDYIENKQFEKVILLWIRICRVWITGPVLYRLQKPFFRTRSFCYLTQQLTFILLIVPVNDLVMISNTS